MRPAATYPNTVTYNATITACAEAGELWREAWHQFSSMRAAEVTADAISFNATTCTFGRAGYWQEALEVCCCMPAVRLSVDEISCNASISACDSEGQWQVSLSLLSSMPAIRLVCNEI
ncbi:unnamed protein product, partial [Symbiodinium sp. CCMP2456]